MSIVTAAAIGLLAAGVAVTALPRLPGGLVLSLAGVYVYWAANGFAEPSAGVVVVLTLGCLLGLSSKLIRPLLVKKVGGTPIRTTTIAGTVGAVCFLIWGTAALVAGTFLTVFVLEYLRRGDVAGSLAASVVVLAATFASKAVRTLVAVAMLVVMVLVVLT